MVNQGQDTGVRSARLQWVVTDNNYKLVFVPLDDLVQLDEKIHVIVNLVPDGLPNGSFVFVQPPLCVDRDDHDTAGQVHHFRTWKTTGRQKGIVSEILLNKPFLSPNGLETLWSGIVPIVIARNEDCPARKFLQGLKLSQQLVFVLCSSPI